MHRKQNNMTISTRVVLRTALVFFMNFWATLMKKEQEIFMCTAISFKTKDSYFGRNLDLERGYNESVVITPRNYEFQMRCVKPLTTHYAMVGMAAVVDNFPLYFEATNEQGVSMAGLNFPGNAYYGEVTEGKDCIAPFELIPWVLGQCADMNEVKQLLQNLQLVHVNFSEQLPLSPLHWMISGKECSSVAESGKTCSIVVESVKEGLKVYENPFEVLTNNPTFDYHVMNMNNYMGLSVGPAVTQFKETLLLQNYSLGMGAIGLPGDYSSASRFVRAFFVKENSVTEEDEKSSVNQFFHILNAVAMPKGCVWTKNGYEYTRYSSCCNADQGVYYYTTYDNFEIKSVDMYQTDLESETLSIYPVEGIS